MAKIKKVIRRAKAGEPVPKRGGGGKEVREWLGMSREVMIEINAHFSSDEEGRLQLSRNINGHEQEVYAYIETVCDKYAWTCTKTQNRKDIHEGIHMLFRFRKQEYRRPYKPRNRKPCKEAQPVLPQPNEDAHAAASGDAQLETDVTTPQGLSQYEPTDLIQQGLSNLTPFQDPTPTESSATLEVPRPATKRRSHTNSETNAPIQRRKKTSVTDRPRTAAEIDLTVKMPGSEDLKIDTKLGSFTRNEFDREQEVTIRELWILLKHLLPSCDDGYILKRHFLVVDAAQYQHNMFAEFHEGMDLHVREITGFAKLVRLLAATGEIHLRWCRNDQELDDDL